MRNLIKVKDFFLLADWTIRNLKWGGMKKKPPKLRPRRVGVENMGLEPMTSTLPAWRSSQLS